MRNVAEVYRVKRYSKPANKVKPFFLGVKSSENCVTQQSRLGRRLDGTVCKSAMRYRLAPLWANLVSLRPWHSKSEEIWLLRQPCTHSSACPHRVSFA